jgi:predicted ATPase
VTVAGTLVLYFSKMLREQRRLRETIDELKGSAEGLAREADKPLSDHVAIQETAQVSSAELVEDAAPRPTVPAPLPLDLVEACARGVATLFVGDAAYLRVNAPDRKDFLLDLGRQLPVAIEQENSRRRSTRASLARLLERTSVDAAVELLEQHIGSDALIGATRAAYSNALPTSALTKLVRDVGVEEFVSLGFDAAVSSAANNEPTRVLTNRSSGNFEQLMTTPGRFLLQLGGDLNQPGTVCLTFDQVKASLVEAPDLRSVLLSMFAARTVIFVGASTHDIEALLDAVGLYGVPAQRHFAIIQGDPDFDIIASRFESKYNIQLIEIVDPTELDSFVDLLVRKVAARKREIAQESPNASARGSLLRRVTVQNIGPFSSATVELSPSWTLILGNNGAGKSTILRAIALVLAGTDRQAQTWARTLLKRGQKTGSVELEVDAVPQPVIYRAQITLEGDRVSLSSSVSPLQAGALCAFGFAAIRGVTMPDVMEPVAPAGDPMPRVSDVLPLLRGGWDERVLDLKAWIRQAYATQQNASADVRERKRATDKLSSFFQVVDEMAPGFDLRFSRCDEAGEILLMTSDGEIPLSYVSQGMTSMIGWLGTLIQRLFELADGDTDPRQSSAVILIDEVDSHLHPEWQQRLVPTLRRTFPNLQVIATTHSALMVGSLEEREIVKVTRHKGKLEIEHLERSYKGYRVDQILTDPPFDLVSTRDLDWEALRDEYADLLGISNRTPEQEARYRELDVMMDQVPPPLETRGARDHFEAQLSLIDAEIERTATASATGQAT